MDQPSATNYITRYRLKPPIDLQTIDLGAPGIEVNTLAEKVYLDKKVTAQLEIGAPCRFVGDERDLGGIRKLTDNAFKFCRSTGG